MVLGQGLRPGDRVAIHWPNSIQAVQLLYGVFKAGLIAVPINLRLQPAEIAFQFRHSATLLCLSDPKLAPLAEAARCPSLRDIVTGVPLSRGSAALPQLGDHQPCVILYTSGTTAQPKGSTHTNRTLSECGRIFGTGYLGEEDTMLAVTSIMHAAALNCVLLPALCLGATAALLPAWNPGEALDAMQQFRCTYTGILPALLQLMVEEQALPSPRRLFAHQNHCGRRFRAPQFAGALPNPLRHSAARYTRHDGEPARFRQSGGSHPSGLRRFAQGGDAHRGPARPRSARR